MEELPFYRRPWFKIATPTLAVLILYVLLHYRQPEETLAGWLVDVLGFAMMFLGTLALASQFILPVRTMRERMGAMNRLFLYALGGHGPIVFVRDGELVGSAEELRRKGAGVILLDGSSGVVLERGLRFSRAAGPGIAFMDPAERVAATLDLRRQSRSQIAQALTRDGIDIQADVTVTFALDPGDRASYREAPDELDILGRAWITPAFPFNPDSAFKAVYGGAVTDKEPLRWTDLPIVVAAEYFRDQISRLTLDDLFQPREPGSSPVSALRTRLTAQVQEAQLLRDRGIKVYAVSLGVLELPEAVTTQRVRSWAARWQKEAFTQLANADVEAERIKEKARAEAQTEMLSHFREYWQELFTHDGESVSKRELAQKLVMGLDRLASDPVTQRLLSSDTVKQLANLRQWVELPPAAGRAAGVRVIGGQDEHPSEDLSEIVASDLPGVQEGGEADGEPGASEDEA